MLDMVQYEDSEYLIQLSWIDVVSRNLLKISNWNMLVNVRKQWQSAPDHPAGQLRKYHLVGDFAI